MAQTALVLLNKGDAARNVAIDSLVQPGDWRDAFNGAQVRIGERIDLEVPAHGVRVLLRDAPVDAPALRTVLARRMETAASSGSGAAPQAGPEAGSTP